MTVMHSEPGSQPEPVERCGSCGQTIKKLNPHRMDSAKVRALLDMALLDERRRRRVRDDLEPGSTWVNAKEGNELRVLADDGKRVIDTRATAYRARQHTSRLYWFGLLDYGGPRSGRFRINDRGRQFLAGTLAVPELIWCRDGAVLDQADNLVTINDVKDVILSEQYWDGYSEWQSYRC